MSVRILIDGNRSNTIDPADRGLAYGDGLFETMRIHDARVPWWDAHWARLARGAQRLDIPLPDTKSIHATRDELIAHTDAGVLKLLLTRGPGGRGYAVQSVGPPTVVLSLHPVPMQPPHGLQLRWCDTRLAIQPALAGIKHCNRLEQVIARREWSDPDIHEGLMRDTDGDVVSAIAANLFVLRDGVWITPPVDRCGIAGVCRDWLLSHAQMQQRRLVVADIELAQALFLCNSVRGILPVRSLGTQQWRVHPQVLQLQRMLSDVHAGFPAPVPLSSSGDRA